MNATANKKELIIGLAMIGCSLAYLAMAYQLPSHQASTPPPCPCCWPASITDCP